MIAIIDLLDRCAPGFIVVAVALYIRYRVERIMQRQRVECERLVEEIRRLDPHTADKLEQVLPAPLTTPAKLPVARLLRGPR